MWLEFGEGFAERLDMSVRRKSLVMKNFTDLDRDFECYFSGKPLKTLKPETI